MHLFSGFFLGGEQIYEAQNKEDEKRQDLDHNIPWYVTGAGTKTYLVGTLTDEVFDQTVPRSLLEEFSNMEKTSVKIIFCLLLYGGMERPIPRCSV